MPDRTQMLLDAGEELENAAASLVLFAQHAKTHPDLFYEKRRLLRVMACNYATAVRNAPREADDFELGVAGMF